MFYLVLRVQCVACTVRETLDVDIEKLINNKQQWKMERYNKIDRNFWYDKNKTKLIWC
jgi:hypothetical protein